MVKFISRGAKPRPASLRFFFHANYDRLAALTEKYRQASPEAAAEIQDEFTAILHDICVDGVWKVTANGRLAETEHAILRFLATRQLQRAEPVEPAHILDLGASDGITSLNLLQAIRRTGIQAVEVTATDLCNALFRYRIGPVAEYRSSGGRPVLVRLGRLGLRLPRSEYRWNWPVTALAQWYLRRVRFRAAMTLDLRISLLNPAAEVDSALRTVELDCLAFEPSMVDRFDAVRASNIIGLRYGFVGKKLTQALANIHAYLHEGGCLIISRNQRYTEIEQGTVWRKEHARFVPVEDFGGGSEIRAAVTDFTMDFGEGESPRHAKL